MAQDHVRKIDGDIKVLKCVVQEMEYCRNTLVPISRLPPETLAVIFSLLPFIAHDSDGVPYLASIYVSRVCRRWREIALSFPSLWSHIHFTKLTPTGIPKILARAKTSPLHLEAKIIPQRKARFNAFVNLLEARISHTRHITISGQFRTMLKRLVSPAPALVFLSLKTLLHPYISSLSQYIIPDSLFNGTAPKLTRLDLYGCSIGSKSPLLKDLQILKIWTPSAQEMPTLQDWLAGLNEMPQLKILTVHHATPTISGDSPRISEPQRIVTLHSLTHSDIFAPANDGALALAHLILPALISLHMAVESRSEDGDDVRLLLPYVARNAYGPQDAAPLQTIEFNGEPMHPQIVAWTIPDADVGVRDSVTLKKVVVSARLDLFITSYSGWRDGMETEISDAMLSHLPLNAISTLSAQNYTRLNREVWLRHAPKLTKLNRVLLICTAVRAFREMLEEDVPPNSLPRLPQLTKLILSKYSLNKLKTYCLRDMLLQRKERGVQLEVLDLRTCDGSERALQLLSETGQRATSSKNPGGGTPIVFRFGGKSQPLRRRGRRYR